MNYIVISFIKFFIIMMTTQNNKSRLLGQSKVAFINYLSQHKSATHNYNQKTIFWDREHVYNENLMLRNKIRELQDTNTKTKTRLRKTEKDVVELSTKSQKKIAPDLTIFRSASSSQFSRNDSHLATMRFRVDSLKQEQHVKKLLLLRKRIRELKQNNQRLKDQNTELKKSLKYTRMSELQEQNVQLQEEIERLKRMINQNLKIREDMLHVFAQEKQQLRLGIKKQVDSRQKISRELRIAQKQLEEMAKFAFDRAAIKRWSNQVKKLEEQNNELKMHISTTKTQMINSAQKQQLTKLEYSQSIVTESAKIDASPTLKRHNHAKSDQLTSLELLTAKNTQEYRTPLKAEEQKTPEPASEPVLPQKQKSEKEDEMHAVTQSKERQNPEPVSTPSARKSSKSRLPSKIDEEVVQEEYINGSGQFQDLMECAE